MSSAMSRERAWLPILKIKTPTGRWRLTTVHREINNKEQNNTVLYDTYQSTV